jgi:tripartite-type tricarboxylate transporter receptor subunit TctC
MTLMLRRFMPAVVPAVLAAALSLMPQVSAQAQAYPTAKPITVLCGFAAGGGGDLICRYYAEKLGPIAGTRGIVENRVGVLGALAAQATAQAKPDGYTLLVGPGSAQSSHLAHFKTPMFDPVKDLTLITTLTRLSFILVVNPEKSPKITNVKELTAWAKSSKTPLKTGGSTTTATISSEWYKNLTGIDMIQVPYKSAQTSAVDLLAGELDFVFMDPGLAAGHLEAGRLRPLAVTANVRSQSMPNIPTMAESGYPEFDVTGWWALYGPANMPQALVDQIRGWVDPLVKTEETRKFFATSGIDPFPRENLDLQKFARDEVAKYQRLYDIAKIEKQ